VELAGALYIPVQAGVEWTFQGAGRFRVTLHHDTGTGQDATPRNLGDAVIVSTESRGVIRALLLLFNQIAMESRLPLQIQRTRRRLPPRATCPLLGRAAFDPDRRFPWCATDRAFDD